MKIYDYKKESLSNLNISLDKNFKFISKASLDNILKFNITFKSPYETGIPHNDSVYSELFLRKSFLKNNINLDTESDNLLNILENFDNEIKLVILVHGFSTKDRKLNVYYTFIKNLLNNNFACFFINLPFHLNRTVKNEVSGGRLIYYDDLETLKFFHQCVVDIRKSIDVIEYLINPKIINICGISLGSMVSVITMAVEKRIKKGALIIGGGHWEEIHWNGILKLVLRGNCANEGIINRNKCHEYYSNYFNFLENFKKEKLTYSISELQKDYSSDPHCIKKCYLCDPLTFAHMINPENVVMINSNLDHFFTKRSTKLLWEELGKPKIYWFNYPHMSSILNKKAVFNIILKFFNES